MYTKTDDPYVECPSCQHTWYLRDAFDYSVGSEIECPQCNKTLECTSEDFTRHWYWHVK